ncbi:ketol-acid reductoisomerase [Stappia aggregata IAM 12614]|nr:ketol-acid reductoisomerase [Stappia aggregata IAM 12614] [Roseibium aggregatum IAM 12614]
EVAVDRFYRLFGA